MKPVNLYNQDPTVITESGQTGWLPTDKLDYIAVDIDLEEIRGESATFLPTIERQGNDLKGYPVFEPEAALSAAGKVSATIGRGEDTNAALTPAARLVWTLDGDPISTAVGTGANSATQDLVSTAGMKVGDTLYFATADESRTIDEVTDETTVELDSAVDSTNDEVVTVTNTPDARFSASIQSRN